VEADAAIDRAVEKRASQEGLGFFRSPIRRQASLRIKRISSHVGVIRYFDIEPPAKDSG
jgi:hypothetical protein